MDVQLPVRSAPTKVAWHLAIGRFATLIVFLVLLFPASPFAATRDTPWRVAEIYIATMGYAPDAEGLDYWVGNIETRDEWTPTTVAQSFFDQPLVQGQYPSELDNDGLIEALYWNIFERAPDAEGFEYWRTQLAQGQIQRNQMIIALIEGGWANPDAAEDMVRFGNRVQVALAFADYQREHSIFYSALGADQQSALREAGRTLLEGIGTAAADVELGIARISDLLDSLLNADDLGGVRLTLVGADSLGSDTIQLAWLADLSTSTATGSIHYRLHAAETEGFVPDASTEYSEVVDAFEGAITGLMPDQLYYVKVEAVDRQGRRSWSNALSVVTAARDPVPSNDPRKVLDATNSADQTVTTDQIDYRLPAGQSAPEPGDLLVSAQGDGYLRRATAVSQSGEQVSIQTTPATLDEVFDNLQFSTEIKLIDLPAATASSTRRGVAQGVVAAQQSGDTWQIAWPESGLTLIQEDAPPAPSAARAQQSAGQQTTESDAPLEVSYPQFVTVEPGQPLTVEIDVAIQAGSEQEYEITQLQLLELSHARIDSTLANLGRRRELI